MPFLLYISAWWEYLNYPGLELWKFGDLAIFVAVAIFVLGKPLGRALAARREGIQQQIMKAQAERDEAAEKLAEVEALLARVDDEVKTIREHAVQEAKLERKRLATAGEQEIEKLKNQAARELDLALRTARRNLRQFLADRSIQLATQSVQGQMRPEDDLKLIQERLGELRRVRA